MDILVQSLLRETSKSNAAIHIRYWDRRTSPGTSEHAHLKEASLTTEAVTRGRKTSYIILRREYAYLEPIIREIFHDAEEARVFIDRRSRERRKPQGGNGKCASVQERRSTGDRRASSPILDVIIDLNGVTL